MDQTTCPRCNQGVPRPGPGDPECLACPACGQPLADAPSAGPAAEEPPDLGDLVTVMTFWSPVEAEMARNQLEAEGIPAYVGGAGAAVTLFGTLAQATLLVKEGDAGRARALLERAARRPRKGPGAGPRRKPRPARVTSPAEADDDEEAGPPGGLDTIREAGKPMVWLILLAPIVIAALALVGIWLSSLTGASRKPRTWDVQHIRPIG